MQRRFPIRRPCGAIERLLWRRRPTQESGGVGRSPAALAWKAASAACAVLCASGFARSLARWWGAGPRRTSQPCAVSSWGRSPSLAVSLRAAAGRFLEPWLAWLAPVSSAVPQDARGGATPSAVLLASVPRAARNSLRDRTLSNFCSKLLQEYRRTSARSLGVRIGASGLKLLFVFPCNRRCSLSFAVLLRMRRTDRSFV